MSLVESLLAIASAEVGVSEDAAPDEDLAGRIAAYRSAVTDGCDEDRRPEPWCADFVSWCYAQAGHPIGPNGRGCRSCAVLWEWLKDEAAAEPPNLQAWMQGDQLPQPGDLVIFDENGNDLPDHTGLVESVKADGNIVSIEGNYSNSVSRVSRGLSKVMGYGRIL
jgi:hypothetical protein